MEPKTAPEPTNFPGVRKGEEMAGEQGIEPGRHHIGPVGSNRPAGRSNPRDATGVNPEHRQPIDPDSVYIPPA